MTSPNSPLVHPKDIQLGNSVIIDASSGPGAFERYVKSHVQGALHADLDRGLSAKPNDPAYGGRHPLPALKDFTAFLGALGISRSSHVIVYDDKNGANAAARLWWMLRALGHDKVQVVDGGLTAIVRERLPMTSGQEKARRVADYPASKWSLPTAGIDEVATAAQNKDYLVIDVREGYRYRGESEPIDLIAGHIPGAVNIPYLENLASDGSFRPRQELADRYKAVLNERSPSKVVVHCGSGVTACHALLAMEHAGITGANLYVGSWSEWSRRNLPIATGNQ